MSSARTLARPIPGCERRYFRARPGNDAFSTDRWHPGAPSGAGAPRRRRPSGAGGLMRKTRRMLSTGAPADGSGIPKSPRLARAGIFPENAPDALIALMNQAAYASRRPWRRCVRPIRRSTNRHPAKGKKTEAHRCRHDPRTGSRRPAPPAFRHRWETRPAAPVWLPFSPVPAAKVTDRSPPRPTAGDPCDEAPDESASAPIEEHFRRGSPAPDLIR